MRKARPVSSQSCVSKASECTYNNVGLFGAKIDKLKVDVAERKSLKMVRRPPPEQNSDIEPQLLPYPTYSPPGHDQTAHRIHQDPCSRLKPFNISRLSTIQARIPPLNNKQKRHNAHPLRGYLLSPINMRLMYQGHIWRSIHSPWYVRSVPPPQ